jgi:glucosamine-6-phosphate deaminase
MFLRRFNDTPSLSRAAAEQASTAIRRAINERGHARIVAATGAAQFQFLEILTGLGGIDWPRVEVFHLDEYIGLPASHPASFRKFLTDRLVSRTGIVQFHGLEGDAADPVAAVREVSRQLASAPVDLAVIGVGENGHIAFNDPPADFETEEPYLIVALDEACRQQQVGEGWFPDLSLVPTHAISMSPRQVLKAQEILAIVPDLRKAKAVKACFEGDINPMAPASILRRHANATVYLDFESSSLLSPALRSELSQQTPVALP